MTYPPSLSFVTINNNPLPKHLECKFFKMFHDALMAKHYTLTMQHYVSKTKFYATASDCLYVQYWSSNDKEDHTCAVVVCRCSSSAQVHPATVTGISILQDESLMMPFFQIAGLILRQSLPIFAQMQTPAASCALNENAVAPFLLSRLLPQQSAPRWNPSQLGDVECSASSVC